MNGVGREGNSRNTEGGRDFVAGKRGMRSQVRKDTVNNYRSIDVSFNTRGTSVPSPKVPENSIIISIDKK